MTTSPIFDSPTALRIARQATDAAIAELDRKPRHLLDEGNPNHPMYDNKIFGYDTKEFMSRQYK
jgi:hypothetical protein